jgi:hypothetical protein
MDTMATERYILIHLERVAMYDLKASGELAFGVTLFTATKDDPAPADKLFLTPWHWGGIQGFVCAFLDGTGALIREAPPVGSPTPPPPQRPRFSNSTPLAAAPPISDADRDLIVTTADNAFSSASRFKLKLGDVSYSPGTAAGGPAPKPWSAVVGRLACAPTPYAQALKLTHQFRVKLPAGVSANDVKYVLAAPIVKAKAAGGPGPAQLFPDQQIAPGMNVKDIDPDPADASMERLWTFDSPDVKARIVPCSMKAGGQSAQEGFLDLETLWINSGNALPYAEDWRASLEVKMATGMDLCQRIIDFLRANSVQDEADVRLLTDMALASIRDQVGPGTRPGPDQVPFIDKLVRIVSPRANPLPDLTDAELAAADAAVLAQFPDVKSWKTWLLGLRLPELQRCSLLSATPRTAAEAGAQLQTLHSTLLGGDGSMLARLFVEQWKDLFVVRHLARPPALTDPNLDKIAALAATVPFRQQLLLGLLGFFWRNELLLNSWTVLDSDVVISRFPDVVKGYFERRYQIAGALNWTPAVAGDNADHRQGLRKDIATWAKKCLVVSKLGDEQPKDESAVLALATTVPHNPSVQVGRTSGLPQPGNRDDVLNHISGIGVFVRSLEKPARRWRCLNMVRVSVPDPNGDGKKSVFLNGGAPVFVPARLGYMNELRQMLVTYSNQPLAGDSPLTQTGMSRTRLQGETLNQDDSAPLLGYQYCPVDLEQLIASPVKQSAAQIPGLGFGASYEFVFFAVSNSGALPGGVGKTTGTVAGAKVYSPVAFLDLATAQPLVPATAMRVKYRRRVPVGKMRVFNFGESEVEKPKNLALPVLPANVRPRAREWEDANPAARPSDTPLLVLPSPEMRQMKPDLADRDKFGFEFGMPSTDRETWQRWVFKSFDDPAKRKPYADAEAAFLNDYFAKAQGQAAPKLQIDDPALLRNGRGYFLARLEKLNSSNVFDKSELAPAASNDVWLKAEPDEFLHSGLVGYQRRTVRAMCYSDGTERFSPVVDAGRPGLQMLEMHGLKGGIYRISIFNCVAQSDLENRFECFTFADPKKPKTVFPAEGPVKINGAGDSVYLVSPFRLLVEVATEELLPRTDLFDAFTCGFDPAKCVLTVAANSQNKLNLRHIYRMETWRQVWRWQGRPTEPHPLLDGAGSATAVVTAVSTNTVTCSGLVGFASFTPVGRQLSVVNRPSGSAPSEGFNITAFNSATGALTLDHDPTGIVLVNDSLVIRGLTLAQWEAVEFGEIEENDHIVFPMPPPGDSAFKNFAYVEQLGGPQTQGDRRGLHFRFAVLAYSRYEGWLPPAQAYIQAASGATDISTIWKPVFVPPRPRMPLAAPKVRIILPLTEGYEGSFAGSPGLLAVLDEAWYDLGGIGEKLIAQVQLTADPSLAPGEIPPGGKLPVFYYETGPDPLFTAAGVKALSPQKQSEAGPQLDPASVEYEATAEFPPEKIRGPVGHSLKPGSVSPLFTGSSFIIPAPRIRTASGPKTDLRGYFCKLRLQRVVRLDPSGSQVASDFTEAYWVQFLPEFSVYDGFDSLARLRLHMPAGNQAELVNKDNIPQTIQPLAASANATFLYLVLTRRVFDVTGRPDQEVFVAILKQDGARWTSGDAALDPKTLERVADSLRARVIEVQVPTGAPVPPPPAKAREFWDYLFPEIVLRDPVNRPEATARIVRISRAIDSIAAAAGACEGDFK